MSLLANAGNLLLPGDGEEIFGPYPLLVPDADGRNVPVGVAPGRYTYVGRLIVEFDASGVVTAIDPASGPMRVVGGDYPDAVAPHAAVQEQVVAPVADFIGALARTPVGTTEVPLDGQRRAVRSQETNQGNLIADALLWQANVLADRYSVPAAHVALQNGGGIRNDTVIPRQARCTNSMSLAWPRSRISLQSSRTCRWSSSRRFLKTPFRGSSAATAGSRRLPVSP